LVSVAGAGQAEELYQLGAKSGLSLIQDLNTAARGRCAARRDLYEARLDPREGDERLSAKKRGESDEAVQGTRSRRPQSSDRSAGKQRSTDLGRALRTIYDDTLREAVPDDFLKLIGKLS